MCLLASDPTSVYPLSGPLTGNNPVTISGQRLGNGNDITEVRFGNATGTIVSQVRTLLAPLLKSCVC